MKPQGQSTIKLSAPRELTKAEKDFWYGRGLWPCCKRSDYVEGPRVGTKSMQVLCRRCGTEMNVIDPWHARGRICPGQMLVEPVGYHPPAVSWLRRLTLSFRGK